MSYRGACGLTSRLVEIWGFAREGAVMATVIRMSRDELAHRRQMLLESVGMTYEELRERALTYTLRSEERVAYETIRSIDYLLGNEK